MSSLDPGSRNELMRVAVNNILQRGEGGKGRDHGNRDSSSSVSDPPYQVSSASTPRDTESIRVVMPVALIKLNMNLCSGEKDRNFYKCLLSDKLVGLCGWTYGAFLLAANFCVVVW